MFGLVFLLCFVLCCWFVCFFAFAATFHSTAWHFVLEYLIKVTTWHYHPYLQESASMPSTTASSPQIELKVKVLHKSPRGLSMCQPQRVSARLCCWTTAWLSLPPLEMSHHCPKSMAQPWPRGWPPKPICPGGAISSSTLADEICIYDHGIISFSL